MMIQGRYKLDSLLPVIVLVTWKKEKGSTLQAEHDVAARGIGAFLVLLHDAEI